MELNLTPLLIIGTILAIFGILIIWAEHSVKKDKERLAKADNRGNLKNEDKDEFDYDHEQNQAKVN